MSDKNNAITYFSEQLRFWLSYHNHKETHAWAVLVMYAALIPLFASSSLGIDQWHARLVAIVFGAAAAYLLRTQLRLRAFASRRVDACQFWLRELQWGKEMPADEWKCYRSLTLPKCLFRDDEPVRLRHERRWLLAILPYIIVVLLIYTALAHLSPAK